VQLQPPVPELDPRGADPNEQAIEREDIVALARACSMEITTRDPSEIDASTDCIEPGADIYVSMPPGQTYHAMVAVAARIRRAGFNPVPHVTARTLAGLAMLDDYLGRATAEAGVTQVLAIGGDRDRPAGPFDSSFKLLETGLFQKHGIRRIGIAGYPEGHPRIAEAALDQALVAKRELARATELELHIVTQFCFDAEPVRDWLGRIRLRGIDLPVRVGLAGPASITTLLRFAMRCGVGNSVRALKARGESIVKLVNDAGPDRVLRELAPFARDMAPVGIHLFSFGGLARTARWIRSVQEDRFEIVSGKPGFQIGAR